MGTFVASKRVTLRDLARELGLSDRAVSQALTPRESNVKLSPRTVERVQKLAQQRNYRPDSRARSMRYGRFYNIGYFEAKKQATAWPLLGAESGVFDAASENDYRVVLIRLPSNLNGDKTTIPSTFREGNLDALILSHAGNLTPEVEAAIDMSGFPVVYLNEKKSTNAVYAEDRMGVETMTQHVISTGRRRIAYLRAGLDDLHYSNQDRLLGYFDAMKTAGLQPIVLDGLETLGVAGRLLELLRRRPQELDAIVTYSDFMALQLFRFLTENGFPLTDIAVTGFGNDFGIECAPVNLTTMKTPFYEMGRVAVEMALSLVDSSSSSIPSRKFPVELIVRDSTRVMGSRAASQSGALPPRAGV